MQSHLPAGQLFIKRRMNEKQEHRVIGTKYPLPTNLSAPLEETVDIFFAQPPVAKQSPVQVDVHVFASQKYFKADTCGIRACLEADADQSNGCGVAVILPYQKIKVMAGANSGIIVGQHSVGGYLCHCPSGPLAVAGAGIGVGQPDDSIDCAALCGTNVDYRF